MSDDNSIPVRDTPYKAVLTDPKELLLVTSATGMALRCYVTALMTGQKPGKRLSRTCQNYAVWAYANIKEALESVPTDDEAWMIDTANAQLDAMFHAALGLSPDGKSKLAFPKPGDESKGGEDA